MLNVSSPSPLYDETASNNISVNFPNPKVNTTFLGGSSTNVRPTLEFAGLNNSSNLSFDDTKFKKTTYEYKTILLGSISVGKTAILSRFVSNEFTSDHQCTIKTEFRSKIVNVNNTTQAKLTIWDTCGDEKYRAITRQYYRDAHGVLLVYDVTNRNSFDKVTDWYSEIKDNAPQDVVVILVANKTDLVNLREVSTEEGQEVAGRVGVEYVEVSAKNGDNVYLLFEKLSQSLMENIENKSDLILENKEGRKIGGKEYHREKEKKILCC